MENLSLYQFTIISVTFSAMVSLLVIIFFFRLKKTFNKAERDFENLVDKKLKRLEEELDNYQNLGQTVRGNLGDMTAESIATIEELAIEKVGNMEKVLSKYAERIEKIEKSRSHLIEEIRQRDGTISRKEKHIENLKRKINGN